MPHNSAAVKINAVRAYGAVADLIDVNEVSRTDRVAQLSADRPDAYIASAFDDQLVIDGNSTLGDELAALGFEVIIIPVGGGGLISGTVQSLARNGVQALVYGAEPLMANDAARSLRAGELIANKSEPQTIADGTRTLSLGSLNWPIIKNGVEEIVEVSEERIVEGVRLFYELANLKVEPTAALPLGAILERRDLFEGRRICVVVTGGNVDADVYASIITHKT
jgi:threonine dehydratase